MSDDLVKRLRQVAEFFHIDYACMKRVSLEAADRIEMLERENNDMVIHFDGLVARIEKLEAALRNIAEGDIPRTVKIPFHDDGRSSSHDRCEHGQWLYEDCGCCVEDYVRKALDAE